MQLQSTDDVDDRAAYERDYDRGPRWGRRFSVAFALLVLLLVGGFYGWTTSGRTQLARQVAVYRAAGDPIEMSDFIVVGVDDDDNAAIPLREAAAGIDMKSDAWVAYEKLDEFSLPLTEKELPALRDVTKTNAAAFDKVDLAMKRKGVDWKIQYRSPVISTLLPDLNLQRQLGRLMVHRAMLNYQQGDHPAAVRDVRRAAFIGRSLDHPFLVGHLVAIGNNSMAADALQQMQPGLKIGTGAGEVAPAEVAELIAQLLDDKPHRASFRAGIHGERMSQLDTSRAVAERRLSLASLGGGGPLGGGPNPVATVATFAAKPVALSDGLLMIRHTTAIRDAYDKSPDWPSYQAAAPPYPKEIQETMFRHFLAKMMLPAFENATKASFHNTAERRMTAIALATRVYALDHEGKPPAKLEELVPKYLPAVPLDPFAGRAQPLKYVNDPEKPIVYSVGDDGVDGGGSELPMYPNTIPRNQHRWNRLDAVVHLKLQPRELPAAEAEDPEIYPNEKAIRAAAAVASRPATQATTVPAIP